VTSPFADLLFRTLLQTGIREQEVAPLEWSDINPETKTLKLQSKPRLGSTLKDYEERELPVNDDLLTRLEAYKKERAGHGTLIFSKTGKPHTHLLRVLKQQVRQAGLNCGKCAGCLGEDHWCDEWFLHKFRATYLTKLLRAGVDLRTVQAMAGHSSLASTMRYLRPAEGVLIQDRINSIKWL
jgi:integrase